MLYRQVHPRLQARLGQAHQVIPRPHKRGEPEQQQHVHYYLGTWSKHEKVAVYIKGLAMQLGHSYLTATKSLGKIIDHRACGEYIYSV